MNPPSGPTATNHSPRVPEPATGQWERVRGDAGGVGDHETRVIDEVGGRDRAVDHREPGPARLRPCLTHDPSEPAEARRRPALVPVHDRARRFDEDDPVDTELRELLDHQLRAVSLGERRRDHQTRLERRLVLELRRRPEVEHAVPRGRDLVAAPTAVTVGRGHPLPGLESADPLEMMPVVAVDPDRIVEAIGVGVRDCTRERRDTGRPGHDRGLTGTRT